MSKIFDKGKFGTARAKRAYISCYRKNRWNQVIIFLYDLPNNPVHDVN
ncbi:MAG: hypothetical protein JEY91_05520 [Spirochaetaceae bacterium]|nr:hypothetical protein [Spirochaetaceae bacterium]